MNKIQIICICVIAFMLSYNVANAVITILYVNQKSIMANVVNVKNSTSVGWIVSPIGGSSITDPTVSPFSFDLKAVVSNTTSVRQIVFCSSSSCTITPLSSSSNLSTFVKSVATFTSTNNVITVNLQRDSITKDTDNISTGFTITGGTGITITTNSIAPFPQIPFTLIDKESSTSTSSTTFSISANGTLANSKIWIMET